MSRHGTPPGACHGPPTLSGRLLNQPGPCHGQMQQPARLQAGMRRRSRAGGRMPSAARVFPVPAKRLAGSTSVQPGSKSTSWGAPAGIAGCMQTTTRPRAPADEEGLALEGIAKRRQLRGHAGLAWRLRARSRLPGAANASTVKTKLAVFSSPSPSRALRTGFKAGGPATSLQGVTTSQSRTVSADLADQFVREARTSRSVDCAGIQTGEMLWRIAAVP